MSDTNDPKITIVFYDSPPPFLPALMSIGRAKDVMFTAFEDMTDEERARWDSPPPPDVEAAFARMEFMTVEISFDGLRRRLRRRGAKQ